MKRPKKYDLLTLLNSIYPIGRGFIDFTNTDYSNYLGFTWERELVNLTPIGCNAEGSNVGNTKGSETHFHYGPLIASRDQESGGTLMFGFSNNFKVHKSIDNLKTQNFYGIEATIRNKQTYQGNAYSTDEESSYQPSKVVAYWKRVS